MHYTNFSFDDKQKKQWIYGIFIHYNVTTEIADVNFDYLNLIFDFLNLNYKFWLTRCLKLVCND